MIKVLHPTARYQALYSTEMVFVNALTVGPHAGIVRTAFFISPSELHRMSQTITMTHAAKARKHNSVKTTKHIGGIKTEKILKLQAEHKGTQ